MRNPSIHITRQNLSTILTELGVSVKIIPELMLKARKFSIRNRVQVTTKAKAKKKSDRSVGADSVSLDRFNAVYMGVMLSNNIKVIPITKISPQHLTLKEVCWQATQFCNLFQMGEEEGFKLYIELGLKLLGNKFGIYRLKSSAQRITDYFSDKLLIKGDKDPEGTDDVITAWSQAVRVFYHTSIELENDAQRVHFIHVREDADSVQAEYYDWMAAQFEKYLYLGNLPAFTQLYGDNALLNYQIYKAKNHKDNKTKEEQEYFTKVKNNEKEIPLKKTIGERQIKEARLRSSS